MHLRFLSSLRAACATMLGLAALSCTVETPGKHLQIQRQPIVNGQRSDETDDSVVYVYWYLSNDQGSVCTGTLIAPNLVATALHCVSYASLGEFSCKPDGTLVPNAPGDGQIGPTVEPSLIEIYTGVYPGEEPQARGRRIFGTGSNQSCRNDIAFVALDREVDVPASPVRLSGGMTRGERVRVVGYGQTEVSGSTGRFRRGDVRISDVGPDSDAGPFGTTAPRTFVVTEGPCHGDSGGPAFSESTGALLGVSSLSAGATCTATGIRNVFTRLEPFAGLAADAFEFAEQEPLLEVDPNEETPAAPSSKGCSTSATNRSGSTWIFALLGAVVLALHRRQEPKTHCAG